MIYDYKIILIKRKKQVTIIWKLQIFSYFITIKYKRHVLSQILQVKESFYFNKQKFNIEIRWNF